MVVTASVAKMADRADAAVFLGITESNLAGRVTGGENRGVTLQHGHVVRARYGPFSGKARDRVDGKLVIKRLIAVRQDRKSSDVALVAFARNLRTGEIYQALSAPVCTDL